MRVRSSLTMLDSLVRSLAMTALDRNEQRVSRFAPRTVPTIASNNEYPAAVAAGHTWNLRSTHPHVPGPSHSYPVVPPPRPSAQHECICNAYTLGNNWSHAQEHTPLWMMTPAWNEEASDAEVRKEEWRRLIWSAVMMVAGYTSFTAANNLMPTLDLSLMEPSNVSRSGPLFFRSRLP